MLQDCLGNTYDFILKTNPRPLGPHQQEEVYEIYISPMKAMFFITCCCCCSVAESCLTLCNPMDCSLLGSCPWDFPGKNTVVGCHFLLQGIFPTQSSNLRLLHWQMDSLPLIHQGSPLLFTQEEFMWDNLQKDYPRG